MQLALIIGVVGTVLLTFIGISWFKWGVYARATAPGVSIGGGVTAPGGAGDPAGGGGNGGGAFGGGALPWLAILGVGGLLLIWRRR